MTAVYNFFVQVLNKLFSALLLLLPVSPFQKYIKAMDELPWLGYLNYFIPVGTLLSIFLSWITALGLYYLYGIIMRWIKIVGD